MLRILIFSINPLFPHTVMGGAPKHLQQIALYLGELGHQVTVLCTETQGVSTETQGAESAFHWHENVLVKPILRFKQPFPQPYGVPAYDFASILQTMGDELATADRFYMHDGEFLLPYAYAHVPTVVSLRDNVYPETIHGGFLFQSHRLILISEYSRAYYAATVGRFFEDFDERVTVIHNGLDWQRFKPTPPSAELLEMLPFDPAQHTVILHPHRPEATKGIFQTLAVVDLLVHQYGIRNLKTLIPRWLDAQTTPDLQAFYDEVQAEIVRRDLTAHIVLHGWIPQHLMPQYYSLGAVTLSLGSFPESFGNAVYESLGCGTPSIAARIATHRELLPDALLAKVDYDDAETAAALAAEIIRTGQRTVPETLEYIHTHYATDRQLSQYADAIINAEIVPPMRYRHAMLTRDTRYQLAPWCYVNAAGRVYHDFYATYASLDPLTAILMQHPEGVTQAFAVAHQVDAEAFMRWFGEGYLVPVRD